MPFTLTPEQERARREPRWRWRFAFGMLTEVGVDSSGSTVYIRWGPYQFRWLQESIGPWSSYCDFERRLKNRPDLEPFRGKGTN
jgi:hypothetical protein